MKNLLLIISLLLITISCSEDDTPPIDQLPEATQEGRGIFGCLVNGEAFVETGSFFNTFYQQIDGGFSFSLGAEFDENPRSIALGASRELLEGETYQLIESEPGNVFANIFIVQTLETFEFSETSVANPGTMTLTRFDVQNGIASGTFSFTVIHPFTGETIEITEGRFDTLFTN